MNDNKLMNRAADNIRILAASMVEKAISSLIRVICLRCSILHWH